MPRIPDEVAPGVWRILLELPGDTLTVNVYALKDAEGRLVLIDTGWRNPAYLEILDDGVRALGSRLEDVSEVIVTHGHPDHAGLASAIQQAAQCALYLHPEDEPMVSRRLYGGSNPQEHMEQWRTYMVAHGMAEADEAWPPAGMRGGPPGARGGRGGRRAMRESTDDDAAELQAWMAQAAEEPPPTMQAPPDVIESVGFETLWTPGHSPGHACFWMTSEQVLFSGDHILPHITPNVQLNPGGEGNPLGDYEQSLDLVVDLPARIVLPAHGEPFTDLRGRVTEILEHHEERTREVTSVLERGETNARAVASGISWKNSTFEELPIWHQRMALGETLAHIRLLVSRGEVDERTDDDGRVWFALP